MRDDLDPDAAWLILSVLSARPLRAAGVADPERLERLLAVFPLEALALPPDAPSRSRLPRPDGAI